MEIETHFKDARLSRRKAHIFSLTLARLTCIFLTCTTDTSLRPSDTLSYKVNLALRILVICALYFVRYSARLAKLQTENVRTKQKTDHVLLYTFAIHHHFRQTSWTSVRLLQFNLRLNKINQSFDHCFSVEISLFSRNFLP